MSGFRRRTTASPRTTSCLLGIPHQCTRLVGYPICTHGHTPWMYASLRISDLHPWEVGFWSVVVRIRQRDRDVDALPCRGFWASSRSTVRWMIGPCYGMNSRTQLFRFVLRFPSVLDFRTKKLRTGPKWSNPLNHRLGTCLEFPGSFILNPSSAFLLFLLLLMKIPGNPLLCCDGDPRFFHFSCRDANVVRGSSYHRPIRPLRGRWLHPPDPSLWQPPRPSWILIVTIAAGAATSTEATQPNHGPVVFGKVKFARLVDLSILLVWAPILLKSIKQNRLSDSMSYSMWFCSFVWQHWYELNSFFISDCW